MLDHSLESNFIRCFQCLVRGNFSEELGCVFLVFLLWKFFLGRKSHRAKKITEIRIVSWKLYRVLKINYLLLFFVLFAEASFSNLAFFWSPVSLALLFDF